MAKGYTRFDIEDASIYLTCALKAFCILREEMETNLLEQKRTGMNYGPEYLLDCCDAMCTVQQTLERVRDGLDTIVAAEYQREKEG